MKVKIERITIRRTDGNGYAIVGTIKGGQQKTLDIKHFEHTALLRAQEISELAGGVEIVNETRLDVDDGPTILPTGFDIVAAEIRLLSTKEIAARLVLLRQAIRDVREIGILPTLEAAKSDDVFTDEDVAALERLDRCMNGSADVGWVATIFDVVKLNVAMIERLAWALERSIGHRPLRDPGGIIDQARRLLGKSAPSVPGTE